MSINGLNVIITGAAAGIGLETVKVLLEEGVNTCVILDINEVEGKCVEAALASDFGDGRVVFRKCNVADKLEFERVVDEVMKSLGRLDVFINNAGVADEDKWERTVNINLEAAIRGCQLATKHMSKENGKKGGTIVNMCSLLGLDPKIWPVYSACKAGLIGYTRCIGDSLISDMTGVRVMALCPGPTETAMIQQSLQKAERFKEVLEKGIKGHGAMQSPKEVSKSVAQILTRGSSGSVWVTVKGEPAYEHKFASIEKSL